MAEAVTGDGVVPHLDHQLRLHRHPLHRAPRRPATRTARRVAGETAALQLFQLRRQRLAVERPQRRGEADMVEPARLAIQAEQQRPDFLLAALGGRGVAEAADDAVGAAQVLDLEHGALAWPVGFVETLGDDAIQRSAAGLAQPFAGIGKASRLGRQPQFFDLAERRKETLQRSGTRPISVRTASLCHGAGCRPAALPSRLFPCAPR